MVIQLGSKFSIINIYLKRENRINRRRKYHFSVSALAFLFPQILAILTSSNSTCLPKDYAREIAKRSIVKNMAHRSMFSAHLGNDELKPTVCTLQRTTKHEMLVAWEYSIPLNFSLAHGNTVIDLLMAREGSIPSWRNNTLVDLWCSNRKQIDDDDDIHVYSKYLRLIEPTVVRVLFIKFVIWAKITYIPAFNHNSSEVPTAIPIFMGLGISTTLYQAGRNSTWKCNSLYS